MKKKNQLKVKVVYVTNESVTFYHSIVRSLYSSLSSLIIANRSYLFTLLPNRFASGFIVLMDLLVKSNDCLSSCRWVPPLSLTFSKHLKFPHSVVCSLDPNRLRRVTKCLFHICGPIGSMGYYPSFSMGHQRLVLSPSVITISRP